MRDSPQYAASVPQSVAVIAAATGLGFGLAEAATILVERWGLRWIVRYGSDVLWMAPVTHLVVCGGLAVFLTVMARRWPWFGRWPVVIGWFSAIGYASLLLLVQALGSWASLILALGLGVQTARLAVKGPRPDRVDRLIVWLFGWTSRWRRWRTDGSQQTPAASVTRREVLTVTGLSLAGLAVGVRGWSSASERIVMARQPVANPSRPNVLLIVMDTVRAANLGVHGYGRNTTPNLGRIARAGVQFDNAFSTCPWTLPSHSSMMTGRYPWDLTAESEISLDGTYPTLAEVLSARGYRTGGFVSNVVYCQGSTGLGRGFAHYSDYAVSAGEIAMSSSLTRLVTNNRRVRGGFGYYELLGRRNAADISREFVTWLESDPGRPFFAFLNFFDAHEPYLPPAPFDTMFGVKGNREKQLHYWDRQGGRLNRQTLTPAESQAELDAYDGSIAYMDQEIGRLVDQLEASGSLDNTLVIVTADHGEQFGEHHQFGHGNTLYLPLIHVPLIVSHRGRVPAGRRVGVPVTLRDVAATIARTALPEDPGQIPGSSLDRHWLDTPVPNASPSSAVLSQLSYSTELPAISPASRGDMQSLIVGNYHYILSVDKEELYDWQQDPNEVEDLARTEAGIPVMIAMRAALKTANVSFPGRPAIK